MIPNGWMHRQRYQALSEDRPRNFVLQYSLYEVQEELLTKRGAFEEEIMPPSTLLSANKPKGSGTSGGFGGGASGSTGVSSGRSTASKRRIVQAQSHAQVLREQGVVRIDKVLSTSVVDALHTFVHTLRPVAENEVITGQIDRKQRFADVLLRKNRCDLLMPLTDVVYDGLYEALCESALGATLQELLGPEAILYELSCLISDPGSDRQVMHPDTPYAPDAVLYTCFMALQDMTVDMGPTCWLPGTHQSEAHVAFSEEQSRDGLAGDSPKDHLLRTHPSVLGVLPKGACAIFDSRCLHAGTANRSTQPRAIFYCSFKSPRVGYPGNPSSMRPELAGRFTLQQLQTQLSLRHQGKDFPELKRVAAELR